MTLKFVCTKNDKKKRKMASSVSPATPTTPDKIRVLCFHGYGQNAALFKQLMKEFERKGAQCMPPLEFHYIQGDYPVPGKENGYMWFDQVVEPGMIGRIRYEESLVKKDCMRIIKYIRENEITALMGYSQGANVVDTLLRYFLVPEIEHAVMIAGCSFCKDEECMLRKFPMETDTAKILHVLSISDEIVPVVLCPETGPFIASVADHHSISEDLLFPYDTASNGDGDVVEFLRGCNNVVWHSKGHNICNKKSFAASVCKFLASGSICFSDEHCGTTEKATSTTTPPIQNSTTQ
jgi:predicted esterase